MKWLKRAYEWFFCTDEINAARWKRYNESLPEGQQWLPPVSESGGRIPLPKGRSWPDPPPSKRPKEADGYVQQGGGI